MMGARRIWLVVNGASGSNDNGAVDRLQHCFEDTGFAVERLISFPDEPLPAASMLEQAGIEAIAVFAGDGTANSAAASLDGWRGSMLVLPGGTMNLLCHRLHGDRAMEDIVRLVATGKAVAARPGVISSGPGTALGELLAGPGTSWRDVRESIRDADLVGVATNTAQAVGATVGEPGIAVRDREGKCSDCYPLIALTPRDGGIRISGFRAETAGEYLEQGWAVLRRRFREGPHDDLGFSDEVVLASSQPAPFPILIDGEPAECPSEQVFRLVPCGVDLLATQADGR